MLQWRKAGLLLWICFGLVLFPSVLLAQQEQQARGLSLGEAIEIVLDRSPMSTIADAGLVAAEQGKRSVRGEFLPKLKRLLAEQAREATLPK